MIWNDAVRPAKVDYWGHWPHERDALFAWIAERGVRGVVLVGGDIHRTRVVQHAAPAALGYDLVELITSPLANSVIAAAAAPHPGLRFDAGVEQSALVIEHDPQAPERLRCEFFDANGVLLHRETLRG
jgi:alkaline phosphatase D